ncbi:MAG: alpha/beta fold hydrolase [Archangium sp.]|nr:alpha/beta fold hydrolase [Archangium sp.]
MEALLMTLLTAAPVTDVAFLHEYAETRRYLSGRPVSVKVTPDGKSALFLRSEAKSSAQMLFELDLATRATKVLLTPEAVLAGASEQLTAAEKARLERQRVSARGFTSYQLSTDGARLLVGLSGKLYVVERADGKVTQLKTGEGACIDAKFSPDGKSVAYVRDSDVQVIELSKNTERRVTKGGTEEKPHGLAEFVAQEEMDRFTGFWFSPDSKSIVFQETDHAGVEVFGVPDPTKPEQAPDRFHYPRAGRKNVVVKLGVVPVAGGTPKWISWDAAAYPYLNSVVWKDGPLTLVVQTREQTKEQVLSVDPKTGRSSVLLTEEDAAWINLNQDFPLWWKDTGFFWATERNGATELELRKPDGSLEASWVKPAAGFGALVGFAPATRTLFFTGGPNPTAAALYKVVDGGAPELVKTPGEALSTVVAKLTGGDGFIALSHTSTRAMPKHVVLRVDGGEFVEVPSVAIEPSLKLSMEIFQLENDGPWAAVIKPSNFVKGQKYPVVLNVYGGPHHLEVLQVTRENLVLQWLANQGFIVVKADGRGTPRRTRAWERAISHDFATPTAADQISALQQLGKRVPELDLSRVGVYGWSFGGYMAALLAMSKGDVIKSAVAGAPVVDWRDYDTFYTERYLGLPDAQPKAYEVSSLLSYVKDSKRPMLLIHGTADDNVYFLHTLKLSDALFKAGKPHSVLPLQNFTHMVPDPLVTERLWERIATWFKETL